MAAAARAISASLLSLYCSMAWTPATAFVTDIVFVAAEETRERVIPLAEENTFVMLLLSLSERLVSITNSDVSYSWLDRLTGFTESIACR